MTGSRAGLLLGGAALLTVLGLLTTGTLLRPDPSPGADTVTSVPAETPTRDAGPPRTAPTQRPSPTGPVADLAAVDRLLEARAGAILAGDRPAFLATLDQADPRFVNAQAVVFDNMQRLGVARVGYGVADRMRPGSPVTGKDPELSPEVVEHVQIIDVDTEPIAYPVGFTFVERDGAWLLGAERFDRTEATLSRSGGSRPWAEGPIAVRSQGPFTVVVDDDRAAVLPDLTDRVVAARRYVDAQLGDVPAGNGRVTDALLVDATSSGARTRLSYDGGGVAGAVYGPALTTTPTGDTVTGVGGWRVKYNPDRLDAVLGDNRILRHELTHHALRGTQSPLWLEEGLAGHLEWRRTPMTQLVVDEAVYDQLARSVPRATFLTAEQFRRNPTAGYLGSQALVEELASRQGLAGVLRLVGAYRVALKRTGSVQEAETAALADTFGAGEGEIARGGYRRLMNVNRF